MLRLIVRFFRQSKSLVTKSCYESTVYRNTVALEAVGVGDGWYIRSCKRAASLHEHRVKEDSRKLRYSRVSPEAVVHHA